MSNLNPIHKFSSTNQPKERRKSNAQLTKALRKKLRDMPEGGKRVLDDVVDMIFFELQRVKDGKVAFSSLHAKLIDMIWDRSEGKAVQGVAIAASPGGAILVPGDMEQALKNYTQKNTRPAEDDDEDEE